MHNTLILFLSGLVCSLYAQTGGGAQQDGASDAFPMFRGDSRLSGVHHGTLPSKLSVLWKFQAPDAISSTACIADGKVYVGCEDGSLFALSLDSGDVKWRHETGSMIQSSPAIAQSTVFFGDDDGVFHALNAEDGAVRWTFTTNGQLISSPNIVGNRVFFGSYDSILYCLDARTGALLWKFKSEGRIHGTPGHVDGNVLVAGCDEYLHILSLTDGTQTGKLSLGSVSGASAAIGGDHVFIGTYGSQVRCLNWKKLQTVWMFEDEDRQFPFMSSAAVSENCIVIGGRDKRIRGFAPDSGKVLWTFNAKGRVDSSAVVVGDSAFVGTSDGNLHALDIRNGKENWRYETGSAITASPAVAAGRLVIGTLDGALYCFGAGVSRDSGASPD